MYKFRDNTIVNCRVGRYDACFRVWFKGENDPYKTQAVDTLDDLKKVELIMKAKKIISLNLEEMVVCIGLQI